MNQISPTLRNEPEGVSINAWSSIKDTLASPRVTSADGVYFHDDTGKRWLDFTAQLFNVNLGHQDRRIVEAIKAQAEKLCFISPFYRNEPREELSRLLATVTPGDLNTFFFMNSGTEANEAALTFARMVTGRAKVMSRYRSYHGTALTTLGVSGDPRRGASANNFASSVKFPNPYCYRCTFKQTYPSCGVVCATSVEEQILAEGPDTIAAIIFEPITGGNGPIVAPPEYYGILRRLCDKYGILMIADEVINGFGRTGKWFAMEHYDALPDMMTVSKGINGGVLPLGAVMMRDSIAAKFLDRGVAIGSTQTGNPLSCAAGVAAIQAMLDDGVVENAARRGAYLMRRLKELESRHRLIGDVRGLGLLAAIELVKDRATREPLVAWNAPDPLVGRIKSMFNDRGVQMHVRSNQLVISPPLIVTEAQLDEGLKAVDEVLTELEATL
ncbi:MAG: aminotransferase class III-fold pyridoxal phosphate-dependent enzyme [Rhodospirillales bacterium]|nr:MAG: aminotransferase class III-fold pyridoxal phosphate-dependent enzyme [Rhodospirillales bacterium]